MKCECCNKRICFWQKKMGKYHQRCWAGLITNTLLELRILDYIEEHKPNKPEDICKEFNLSLNQVGKILSKIVKAGGVRK